MSGQKSLFCDLGTIERGRPLCDRDSREAQEDFSSYVHPTEKTQLLATEDFRDTGHSFLGTLIVTNER